MAKSLENLPSFGDVAAEDDPVLDYFLKTDAVQRIKNNQVFLILGRKGSGKTALVRFFTEASTEAASRSLSLRGYPWQVHAERVDHGASKIEAYVASWRYLICLEVAILALSKAEDKSRTQAKAIENFLKSNYGGLDPNLNDILRPTRLQLAGTSLEPEMFGFKLGSIEFERRPGDLRLGAELTALSNMLLNAAVELASAASFPLLLLHFDELDQGITIFDEERAQMLTGLVLAARDIRHQTKNAIVPINPVVYLRTDLWEYLAFSDKNKISQTASLNLEWSSSTLQHLVNARLEARLGAGTQWEDVVTEGLMRGSQTKWNHVLSRTFLRPRDVIKFLNAALVEAKRRKKARFS